MNRSGVVVVWVAALAFVAGCGKEVGRVSLSSEGEGDASVTLKAKQELGLWTKLDASWDGSFSPRYEIELRDGSGTAVAKTTCDPLNVSTRLASTETNLGDHHTRSYSGKMRCDLVAPADGAYTVHVKLSYGVRPATLTVKDISLVLKL